MPLRTGRRASTMAVNGGGSAMANEEHVARLKQGAAVWNAWRDLR